MSTSAQTSPAWKQEVNRRLAEHRGRKGASAAAPAAAPEIPRNASPRAAAAAARVAARYANAPSYGEMLAGEARAALRAAEAASEAAFQARAAAQSVLAGIEAAQAPPRIQEVMPPAQIADSAGEPVTEPVRASELQSVARLDSAPLHVPSPLAVFEDDFFSSQRMEPGPELVRPDAAEFASQPAAEAANALRWDLEPPTLSPEPVEARAARGQQPFATGAEQWWRPADVEPENDDSEIEVIDPFPIHANLIEFPRELVAAHKARPRLAESPSAAPASVQLSIFEVDPASIAAAPSVEPETEAGPAPAWSIEPEVTAPTWSSMELEAQPVTEAAEQAAPETEVVPALNPAPASMRAMALVVDGALIAGLLLVAAMVAASHAAALPTPRAAELGMGAALLLIAILYEALFFTLASATPGMRYARLRLSTFDGAAPDRSDRCKRLALLLVSALPAGLGLAWCLFDDDHLSWHDRHSRTYLCKQ